MKIVKTKKFAQSGEHICSNNIKVDVLGDGLNTDAPINVNVQYEIDVDFRSFGIKEINIYPLGVIDIPLLAEDGSDFVVQVDCTKVKLDKNHSGGVWINALELHLVGRQVDYRLSSFSVSI